MNNLWVLFRQRQRKVVELNKLVVMVSPAFGKAELIEDHLKAIGYGILEPKIYKNEDEYFKFIMDNKVVSRRKNDDGKNQVILFDDFFKAISCDKAATVLALGEYEQLRSVLEKENLDVELFVYFVTDSTENLLYNALYKKEIESVNLKSIISMIRKEVYWGSANAGQFHGILRNVTDERANLLADVIVSDVESAVHVDSFE
jgi:hypothetical protein